MKKASPLIKRTVFVWLIALAGCVSGPITDMLPITVDREQGKVVFSDDGVGFHPLTNHLVFKAPKTICTGRDSLVDVTFDKKPERTGPYDSTEWRIPMEGPVCKRLRICEETTVRFDYALAETTFGRKHWNDNSLKESIRLYLASGSIMGNTYSTSESPAYEVAFSNGVTTLSKDTIFTMISSGEIFVLAGAASVYMASSNAPINVTNCQMYTPASGIVRELTTNEFRVLYGLEPYFHAESEWVTMPGKFKGLGGSMRKF